MAFLHNSARSNENQNTEDGPGLAPTLPPGSYGDMTVPVRPTLRVGEPALTCGPCMVRPYMATIPNAALRDETSGYGSRWSPDGNSAGRIRYADSPVMGGMTSDFHPNGDFPVPHVGYSEEVGSNEAPQALSTIE